MTELAIIKTIIIAALLIMFLIVVLGLIHPEYVTATSVQTEIPVNKLRCTDIKDGICVEWTEFKITNY